MVRYENECCDCAVPGYPCQGSSCRNVNVPRYYCDKCTYENEILYWYNGEQWCLDCIEEDLKKVNEGN